MRTTMMIRSYFSICLWISLLLIAVPSLINAQEGRVGYGVFGDFNLNKHRVAFTGLPGVPSCCPKYETGNGTGLTAGVLLDIPFSVAWSLLLRASYVSHSSLVRADEATMIAVDGNPAPALIEHSIDARISSFGIEPMLTLSAFDRFRIMIGTHFGVNALSRFDQSERLVEPADVGTFENNLRVRNIVNNEIIPNASTIMASLLTGISYSLPMNDRGTLTLMPEIMYTHGLTPIVSSLSWKADAIRAGIAVKYTPERVVELPPPPVPVIHQPQPVVTEKIEHVRVPKLTAAITALGVDSDGIEQAVVALTVEEFMSEQTRPLLPYMFFAEGSSHIDNRYVTLTHEQSHNFSIDKLHDHHPLDIYYNMLNVIGMRLNEHPRTRITITGCNDGGVTEVGIAQLSRKRAESVRDYLVEIWGISPDRMIIRERNLPAKPTTSREAGASEENRRVEIESETWDIMAPVTTQNIERQVTPPLLRFKPVVESETGLHHWSINVRQGTEVMHDIKGDATPPEHVDWRMSPSFSAIEMSDASLHYRMSLADISGQKLNTPEAVIELDMRTIRTKVVERTADKEIRRYNLILFDFDSPNLNRSNLRMLQRVRSEISEDANVTISGYTDRMGDAAYNQKLSLERALNVANATNQTSATIKGFGETIELYDNTLPEGRFLSRTVEIIVETPIQH